MTWNAQPATVTPRPSASRKRTVTPAIVSAVLLLPALVLAKIAVLATETGSRCLVYGGCTHFPIAAFAALLGVALVAMVVALAAPPVAAEPALAIQILLETMATGLVLAYP
ncbi:MULTISPECIES: hypothetical protein [unclassified Streptomyces]|uniref:hypothetical protein n=1 Tax=unclassified Streptomyces TaxID=2593676 RepID=UPI00224DCD68|nr:MULTISPECIES: hypothetical protein [unclassified Streptomyces]MCX4527299.1 hypothetical protein [Streptomyces sp. NBC_01551]MCX4542121.1 hypothetical protein [Streptomyces sp. NBC_01565]